MNTIKEHWNSIPKIIRIIFVLVLLIVVILIFIGKGTSSYEQQNREEQLTFNVKRGPLTINVIESGTIKARDQVIIKSEVEGSTSLLWLIEEGITVKEGELLIELDGSQLQDNLVDQQIKVQNNEAKFIRARENLAVAKNQAQSDIDKAELEMRFALLDLQKYLEGEYPKELLEAESQITVAREELQRAEDTLKWSNILFKEKYISQTELQADELAANKARLDLELAEESLKLLGNFTNKRKVDELESNVKQTKMANERVKRKASADIVQAEADLWASESEFNREKGKLDKLKDQIEKTKIYAPGDGLVIYATTAQGNWRGNAEPLAVGQVVKEREELIHLPKTTSVLAELKIHESSLDKVKVGLPVTITIDALPGQDFAGRVASISPLPDATSMWLNPDLKLYNTIVHLDGGSSGLRTGMSCRAEILVEKYEDAVYVPLQAVLRVDDSQTVYVLKGKKTELREVKTGLDNNRMIHILSGLTAGEEVLLTPPFAPSSRQDKAAAIPEKKGAERKGAPKEPGTKNQRPGNI